jgi:uncharacterized protein YegL
MLSHDASSDGGRTPDLAGTPVHVLFVIDSSGSMGSKANDVRGGFNSYMSNLREDTTSDYRLTAVTFDTRVTTLFTDIRLSEAPILDDSNYRTGGNTALYDALGISLAELTSAIALEDRPYGKDRVLVIVMTDGEENSSHRFTKEQVTGEMKRREEAGNWTFVYLGADQDAWAAAQGLGFAAGNVAAYAGSATKDVFQKLARSTTNYSASSVAQTQSFGKTLDQPDDPAADEPKSKP